MWDKLTQVSTRLKSQKRVGSWASSSLGTGFLYESERHWISEEEKPTRLVDVLGLLIFSSLQVNWLLLIPGPFPRVP